MLQAARQQAAVLKNDERRSARNSIVLMRGNPYASSTGRLRRRSGRGLLMEAFFGRDYRGAVKTYRRIVLAGKKAPRAHMSRALQDRR